MTVLVQKLHPARFTGMSPKMAAIVGYLVGEEWTDPAIHELSITSDGVVIAWTSMGDQIIGGASDLEMNLRRLVEAAELTEEEASEFWGICRSKVTDWRYGYTVFKG